MDGATRTAFAEGMDEVDIIWENPCFIGKVLSPPVSAPALAPNEMYFYTRDHELITLRFPEGHPLPVVDTWLSVSARAVRGELVTFEALRYRTLTRNK